MRRLVALLLASAWLAAQGQSSERLPWVNGDFPDVKNGFEYRVARGEAATLGEARLAAQVDFAAQISFLAGSKVSAQAVQKASSVTESTGKSTTLRETLDFQKTTLIGGEDVNVAFIKVDECYEYVRGRYQLWELYELSITAATFKPYIPKYTYRYGFAAAWRSALLPGWGQLHKEKVGKGIFFFAAEVAAVSGAVYCELRRAHNLRMSQESTNLAIIKVYRSRADGWTLYRNLAVGAAAGIYAWNVLDAALAKGKVRYAWLPDRLHLNAYAHNEVYSFGVAWRW